MNKFLKKYKFVILFVFLTLCVIVLLFFTNKSEDNELSNRELKLECSKSFIYDGYEQIIKVELYKDSDNTYLVQRIAMKPNINLDDELSESILYQLNQKTKQQVENEFKGNKFIDYNVYMEENQFVSEISYTINKENETDMNSILEYDYYTNSVDDIILKIEKGGLKCLQH